MFIIIRLCRPCSQLKMEFSRRRPIPLSFTKARFTVNELSSCSEVIDTVSDLLTDFPVGTRLHWMRKAMRVRLETPRWGTHHWMRPIHSRSANTHTARKSTNASYEWRSEILQCEWSTNTFLLKTITFWGFICLPLGLGFAQFAFNFLYILWHFNVWHFSLQSIDIIFLECSHVQGYEFPTYCIVNYRLSVLGDLRHTCPGALLFLVQSGYIFLHRWGRIPSLDI